ncbi:MAG: hypothetical protein RLZZ253_1824 [Verrucomicrobiota bacterium]
MQTVRLSATPRLCHPAGVRALFGPVSGGVATHRLLSYDASGISRGSRREPEGCTNASGISGGAPPAVSGGSRAQLLTGTGF